MKKNLTLKTLILATTLLLVGMPRPGLAQEAKELEQLKATVKVMEQTIKEMNRKLVEMEKQMAASPSASVTPPGASVLGVPPATHPGALPSLTAEAAKSDLADEATKIPFQETMADDQLSAPRPGNAPLDPTYEGFMPLLGTKTWIKLGGYAKLDMIMDSTKVGNPNEFITSKIPVEGQLNHGKGENFTMQTKQTRMNLEMRSPTPLGSLKIFYENDFYGSSDQSSMEYRLRHFYGQIANLTVGQTWSTFYDPDVNPDTLDFEGPNMLPVLRQAQVRYTFPIKQNSMFVALAVEQPKADLSGYPGGTDDSRNTMPDLIANWRWEGNAGHVQFAGLMRRLSFETAYGTNNDNIMGWGLNLSGLLKTFEKDSLLASFSYGEGIGRYIQDLPNGNAGVVDAYGNTDALTAWGGMVGYRHQWSEKWRSTVSYSYVQLDNTVDQGSSAYDNAHYSQANIIWAPTKHMYIGLEYLFGRYETRDGNSGDDHRIQLSIRYNLIR